MNDRTRSGLAILAVSVAAGVLGDALLRATPWGLNALLWAILSVAGLAWLAFFSRVALDPQTRLLLGVAILAAAGFVWRDSPILHALDLTAFATALALAALRTRKGRLLSTSLLRYAEGLGEAVLSAITSVVFLVTQDIEWRAIPSNGALKHARAVGRGLLIALPLLLVFGALFMAADAVFDRMITRAFHVDPNNAGGHLAIALICAWLFAGFARGMFHGNSLAPQDEEREPILSLGIIEIGIVLTMLDLLFLAFVVVQFKYFFGGDPYVQVTPNFTYADYARRGFFELAAVAALVLPLQLAANALLHTENRAAITLYRTLAAIQLALLAVIITSAVQRMRLYQIAYGMTEIRFYTMAFMGWLVAVFIWFADTVLRGQRLRFPAGLVATAIAAIALLNILNPDGWIVSANTARYNGGKRFDAGYAATLSADAVPALTRALPYLKPEQSRKVAVALEAKWLRPGGRDWRSWSWSRACAAGAVKYRAGLIHQLAALPASPPAAPPIETANTAAATSP